MINFLKLVHMTVFEVEPTLFADKEPKILLDRMEKLSFNLLTSN